VKPRGFEFEPEDIKEMLKPLGKPSGAEQEQRTIALAGNLRIVGT
jgi:hypothetical protein